MPYVHTKTDRPPAKPVLGGGGRGPTRDWPGGEVVVGAAGATNSRVIVSAYGAIGC